MSRPDWLSSTYVRQFWITSKNDDTVFIDLMDKDSFGASPSGLEGETDNTLIYADQDAIVAEYGFRYGTISFTVYLGAESDRPYLVLRKNIIKQLNKGNLVLHYLNGDDVDDSTGLRKEYLRDVNVVSLTKTDTGHTGAMSIELTLQPVTPWYIWETVCNYSSVSWNSGEKATVISKLNSKYPGQGTAMAASIVPFDTYDCMHLIDDITVPIYIEWYNSSSVNNSFGATLYDSDMNVISDVDFDLTGMTYGQYFKFSSDFRDPFAKITDSSGTLVKNVMTTLSTNSTGMLRAYTQERQYLYIKNAALQSSNRVIVNVRNEAIAV